MHLHRIVAAAVLCVASGLLPAVSAEEGVRYYEDGGLMYCETRIKLRHPVSEVKYKELKQTHYRNQYTTELHPVVRNTYVPVTTYGWQPEVMGKWNPFVQPHIAYRPVPRVSWSVQPQTVQVPVTRRSVVPETRTIQVPETNLRYVEREYVRRVPVGPAPTIGGTRSAPGAASTVSDSGQSLAADRNNSGSSGRQQVYRPPNLSTSHQQVYGGVARYEADPPRYGVDTGSR